MKRIVAAALLSLGLTAQALFSSHETETVMNVLTDTAVQTEFSSQARERPRIRVQPVQPPAWDYPRPDDYSWPGPGAVRQCVDWYATEYRPSGTVVTPQMRCRWVRG